MRANSLEDEAWTKNVEYCQAIEDAVAEASAALMRHVMSELEHAVLDASASLMAHAISKLEGKLLPMR